MQKKIFGRLISFFVAFTILTVSALTVFPQLASDTSAAPVINDATVQEYEKKLAEIAKEQAALKASLAAAQKNEANAKTIKEQLDRQLTLTQEKIQYTEDLIAELGAKIVDKQAEIDVKEAEIEEQKENLKALLRIIYEEGDVDHLDLLLGAKNLYDFLVRAERVKSIVNYNTRSMKKFQEEKTALVEQETALKELETSQKAYGDSLELEKASLDAQREENDKYLSSIKWSEEKYKAEILENQKLEQQLDKELEAYIKEQQAKLNAQYYGGEFIWPVDATKWKRISSKFGWRDLYGVKDFHLGIDIPCYTGESVWASNGGTVIVATYHYSYGNYVVIDHGGGYSTLYAHNSKLLVKVGDKVTQKQVIALAGNTGNSYGSHCHFEVRLNGERQEPLNYVTQPK